MRVCLILEPAATVQLPRSDPPPMRETPRPVHARGPREPARSSSATSLESARAFPGRVTQASRGRDVTET